MITLSIKTIYQTSLDVILAAIIYFCGPGVLKTSYEEIIGGVYVYVRVCVGYIEPDTIVVFSFESANQVSECFDFFWFFITFFVCSVAFPHSWLTKIVFKYRASFI